MKLDRLVLVLALPLVAGLALVRAPRARHLGHLEHARPTLQVDGAEARRARATALGELGRRLFSEPALSASGAMSCATCHRPERAYGPPADFPVRFRAVPSLRYLQTLPGFRQHAMEDETGVDQGPTGGFMWDGRAENAHAQAELPLFDPAEMANTSRSDLGARIAALPYVRDTFGELSPDRALAEALHAIEVFEESPKDFAPFSSRFDAYLRGRAPLSAAEQRGLALFRDRDKGNCDSCHPSGTRDGSAPLFTDFGYANIGVPGDGKDRGLCGPLRKDLADKREWCGSFRTPSLRNVGKRDRFFHDGSFRSLEAVVRFYVTRDSAPGRWGRIDRSNVNVDPPFGKPAPALTEAEISDVVAFLRTLDDE